MRYRYLTFDCYGTLVDWRKGISEALAAVAGGSHVSGSALLAAYVAQEKEQEKTYQRYSEVLRKAARGLSGTLGTEIREDAARRFAASVPRWPAFRDSARFLKDAGAKGYRRYILSNVDTDTLEETIGRNGFEIDGYVTAEEVRSYKPRAGHWERFLEKTGAKKGEVLHVAQSVFHDILPAQRMGMDSAWINRYGEALPAGAEPTVISDSLMSLDPLLEEARH